MKVTGISISFKGTIPTQAYGNIALDVTWQAELSPDDNPEQSTQALFARIRSEVIKAVEPIAKARAKGMESALSGLPQSEREKIMQAGGVFNFLNMIAPELAFAENTAPTIGSERQRLGNDVAAIASEIESLIRNLSHIAAVSPIPVERKAATNVLNAIQGLISQTGDDRSL